MKKLVWILLLIPILQSCQFGSYPQGSGGSNYPSNGGSQYPTGGGSDRNTYPSGGNQSSDNYPTNPTQNGKAADKGVSVGSIRLTDQYTILYLTFTNNEQPQYDKNGRMVSDGSQPIAFQSTAQLIAAGGARNFKFIKAEGIPVVDHIEQLNARGTKVATGQSIKFVVYYQRLDKGLEDFDQFECTDYDHIICWNIYGLHVNNPADVVYQPVPTQTPSPSTIPAPATIPAPSQSPSGGVPSKTKTKSGKVGEVDNTPTPAPVPIVTSVQIAGIVRDSKTNRPLSATIDYKLSSGKQAVDSVQSFASTGIYRITLQKGQVYTYTASARGYLAVNDIIDLSKISGGQKISKDIYLTPIAVGDKIVLKNIYFEVSKSDLLAASFAELNKLATMMQDNPYMEIRLEGHTDVVGDAEANLELSQDRVNACEAYLVKQGISTARIQAVGYGDTRPIVKKGTDEERKVNRRVEFAVLKL